MHEFSFRVDAKMAQLLGEQSVSNSTTAIFELVKNGYDADANSVEVIFQGVSLKNGNFKINEIRIQDDGVGMTFEDIENKWMVIGTNTKEREQLSPLYQRRVVGEKGIGRFATQKLGSIVTIISDPKNLAFRKTAYKAKRVELQIDWNEYKSGKTLDKITHEVHVTNKPIANHSGTIITIQNLKQEWSEEDIIRVRDRLSVLVVPQEITREIDHPFQTRIITVGFSLPDIEIESNLFKKAPEAIIATLKGDEIRYEIYDRGQKVKKEIYDEPIKLVNPSCGNFKVKIYHYPQDRANDQTKPWAKYYNKYIGANNFENLIRRHSGVKIYNDKIRVLPYGEPGNDWLDLNSRQLGKFGGKAGKINNRATIGFVLLNRNTNKEILETTTREGLVKNQAFEDLKLVIYKIISQLESFRGEQYEKRKDDKNNEKVADETKDHLDEMKDTISSLPISREQSNILKYQVSKIDEDIEKMEIEHKDEIEEFMYAEQMYRNLSTVGISTISFSHEIVGPLVGMDITLANMRKDLVHKSLTEDQRKEKIVYLTNYVANMLNWAKYIRAFTVLIGGSGKIKRRQEVDLKDTIQSILDAYRAVFEENLIQVILSIPEYVSTLKMNKADLESILMNLFTNSVKSLKQVPGEKRIRIEANATISSFNLKFSDNGIGINKNDWRRVFEPLYTTYANSKKGLVGTGMGLTIVKEILTEYDGTIEVVPPEWSKGASFWVSIPIKNVIKSNGSE